jgi:hypothetical protein
MRTRDYRRDVCRAADMFGEEAADDLALTWANFGPFCERRPILRNECCPECGVEYSDEEQLRCACCGTRRQ